MAGQKQKRNAWGWHPRLFAWAIILALLVVFIAENFETVEVRLIVARTETRLAWALLLAAVLGFGAGLLLPRLHR